MKLQTYFGTLAESTPFTDMPLGVYWEDCELYDETFVVGRVARTLAGAAEGWMADPYWNEQMHFFDTQEEAKAWLVAMYKMGGANEPKQRRRVRPVAR